MRRMAGWRGVSWLYARILPTADRLVLRLSGRKLTLVAITTGLPVLLLTTIGAKTGALRVNPVLYLRSGENFVVIASNWGQRHNPKINSPDPPLTAVCTAHSTQPFLPVSHPPDPHPRQRFSWTRQERPPAGQSKLADLRPGSTHRTNAVYIHTAAFAASA
jgi:F420H(2)-dependent quinone reductase